MPRREWPAAAAAISAAQLFLEGCEGKRVVIVCDSDVDGLTSAVLIERALASLGVAAEVLSVRRGESVHHPASRNRLRGLNADRLIVLDTGSRPHPILDGLPTLIIDHHDASRGTPAGALVVNGFNRPPVATSSLLAFVVASGVADLADSAWLAALGAVADLGSAVPFSSLLPGKLPAVTASRTAASLLNAARRAPNPDPSLALDALRGARSPQSILASTSPAVERLRAMQAEVRLEIDRCSRIPPTHVGQAALLRFSSGAQVHPVVAIRWARRLSPRITIAANDGYIPGRTNFAVRSAEEQDLLTWMRRLPFTPVDDAEYGNGHARATGGSLSLRDFEAFLAAVRDAGDPRIGRKASE